MRTEQRDLFEILEPPPEGFPTAAAGPVDDELLHQRHRLIWNVLKPALCEAGIYGYPNLIRNPDGPWSLWDANAKVKDPEPVKTYSLCWPAIYAVAFRGDNVRPCFRLAVRPGQRENLAVLTAIKVFRSIGDVEIGDDEMSSNFYELREPRFPDEIIWSL